MEMKLHVQNILLRNLTIFLVGIGESLGKSIPMPSGTFHNYLKGKLELARLSLINIHV